MLGRSKKHGEFGSRGHELHEYCEKDPLVPFVDCDSASTGHISSGLTI